LILQESLLLKNLETAKNLSKSNHKRLRPHIKAHKSIEIAKLQLNFGAVGVCQGVQKGKSLIWLRPSLFFNPQVGIYYGTMMANVYDGKGKYINKYAGESKVQGSFFSGRQENITESYRVAMGDLITKLKADNALTETIAADVASGDELASCSQVPNLPANLPTSGLKK
jgi:hypothetical protein